MPDAREFLTPPEVGRKLRMKADRVIVLIRAGELRASNVATRLSGRPRYRVAASDLAAFLERRAAASVAAPAARRRTKRSGKPAGWVSYYNM